MRRGAVVVAGACLAIVAAAGERAGPAAARPPFATAAGPCPTELGFRTRLTGQAGTSAHPTTLIRLATSGGAGAVSGSATNPGTSFPFGASDAVTLVGHSIGVGQSPSVLVECLNTTSQLYAEFADVDRPPASFSGRTSPGSGLGERIRSELPYLVPGTARYYLDVAVSQGTVRVTPLQEASIGACGRFDSRVGTQARIDLGTLGTAFGSNLCGIELRAFDGPPAAWNATVGAYPGKLSALKASPAAIRSGRGVATSFQPTADATLAVTVLNARERPVRTLARGYSVKVGKRSIRWDGLTANGGRAASGLYTVVLVGSDINGFPIRGRARVVVDNRKPSIKRLSKRRVGRGRSLAFKVTDKHSKIRSASLSVDGRRVRRLRSGTTRLIYRPSNGWRPSVHRYSVRAKDKAGNTLTLKSRFRVR